MQTHRFQLLLLDLDGTLYVGDQVIPGTPDALQQLRARGYQLRFLTNTTTRSQAQLLTQLRAMGFSLTQDELISAPAAARLELRARQQALGRPLRLWPVVDPVIAPDFAEFVHDEKHPDAIVLGDIGERWDLALINRLFNAMHAGAELIALHKNRYWQTAEGLKADIGLFVTGLEYVASQQAQIMGKPSPAFFQRVLDSVGVLPAQALLVGDDVDSDVGGAQAMGICGLLVKTGKYRQAYVEKSAIKPDAILPSLADLPDWLSQE